MEKNSKILGLRLEIPKTYPLEGIIFKAGHKMNLSEDLSMKVIEQINETAQNRASKG